MFAGFDPSRASEPFFQRRRGMALTVSIFLHVAVAGLLIWFALNQGEEEIVDVALDEPEIENLAVEEEMEIEEEEPEPEPEPEKPKPKPKSQQIQNVKEQTKNVSESDVAVEREPEPEATPEPAPEKPKPAEKPAEQPKPKKKKPSAGIGDRTKPRAMPAEGTPPKPKKTNKAPAYPEELRKKNITGTIKVKLNIHMGGSVRGMKVLKKKVSGTEDPAEIERAQKLFLKAVIAAVKTWGFEPAKLKGKTITVWWPVTIPFNLN